jgi:hypothetical protein
VLTKHDERAIRHGALPFNPGGSEYTHGGLEAGQGAPLSKHGGLEMEHGASTVVHEDGLAGNGVRK